MNKLIEINPIYDKISPIEELKIKNKNPDLFNDGSLIAYYNFDLLLNDYYNEYNLSLLEGTPTYDVGIKDFCESSSRIVLGTPINKYLIPNYNYTVSFWIKANSHMIVENWPGILVQGTENGYGCQIGLASNTNELCVSKAHASEVRLGISLSETQWQHVIISSDGNNGAKSYLNGVFIKDLGVLHSNTDSHNNTGRTQIKSYYNNYYKHQSHLDAQLDDLKIFNRSITEEEAYSLYIS